MIAGAGYEVLVVDNASSDGTTSMLERAFPQVRLIANDTNLGFAKANNQGITQSRGRYLLLLNPDTEVVGDALRHLLEYMRVHPRVGVLGPQLLNPDGTLQSSRRRFPTLSTAFIESTPLQPFFAHSHALGRYYCLDQDPMLLQEVDWVVGACMMVRREAVLQAGMLDEAFFLYFDELDWCRRIKEAGWRVVYFPMAKVVHHYGRSSEQDPLQSRLSFNDSKCRYHRKYHGRLAFWLLRGFLFGTYLLDLALEGMKYALGHKRSLRRERLLLLLKAMRQGLPG